MYGVGDFVSRIDGMEYIEYDVSISWVLGK